MKAAEKHQHLNELVVRTEDGQPVELFVVLAKGPRKTRLKSLKDGVVRSVETRYLNVDFYSSYHELGVLKSTHERIVSAWEGGTHADNFYIQTQCDWTPVQSHPDREPDHVSGSGSAYWYADSGVYRRSDHWLPFTASCDWSLDGMYLRDEERVGFASWGQFAINPRFRQQRESEVIKSKAVLAALGALLP